MADDNAGRVPSPEEEEDELDDPRQPPEYLDTLDLPDIPSVTDGVVEGLTEEEQRELDATNNIKEQTRPDPQGPEEGDELDEAEDEEINFLYFILGTAFESVCILFAFCYFSFTRYKI